MRKSETHGEDHAELVCAYAMEVLPPDQALAAQQQIFACAECQSELESLQPLVDSFVSWPVDVLRPPGSLWDRLSERVSAESGTPVLRSEQRWVEPRWREVSPGIHVKALAVDPERNLITMYVRLEPGVEYPPHVHAGVEELHLLYGALWIDDRKLCSGDYSRADPGSADRRVWSETGCTCVLITSLSDVLS